MAMMKYYNNIRIIVLMIYPRANLQTKIMVILHLEMMKDLVSKRMCNSTRTEKFRILHIILVEIAPKRR